VSDLSKQLEEYWDARPCNVRHGQAPVGTPEYFAQVDRRRYFVEPHILGFADFARWYGKTVLELGCGIGTDAARFVEAGAHYTGIDASAKSLEIARQHFPPDEVGQEPGYSKTGPGGDTVRHRLLHGDIELLPEILPPEKFSLVYCWGVLHHTPHPERVVEHLKQYMGPGSELCVMVYARDSWKRAMIDEGIDQPEAQYGCPLARTYTRAGLVELLDGFDILEMRQEHIFPYIIEDYIEYRYRKQPWFENMPADVFRAIEKNFGWHLLVRCRLS